MLTPKGFTHRLTTRYNVTWTHFRGNELNFDVSSASFPFLQIFKISIEIGNSMGAIHSTKISNREQRSTSRDGPVLSKLFRLDRTDPLSFGPKFPEILVEWIVPYVCTISKPKTFYTIILLIDFYSLFLQMHH